VDVGCGAGDLLRAVGVALESEGRTVRLTGIDGNPATVAYARRHVPSACFEAANVMDSDFVEPVCDVFVSSHFVYNLSDEEAATFVVRQQPRVAHKLIIRELVRSRLASGGLSGTSECPALLRSFHRRLPNGCLC
jgi:SAM-dependent methyltransferase